MHRVFVTGGTGFVGRAVVHALRSAGHVVRCCVRRGSERDLKGLEAIERVEGDVLARESLIDGMDGCDVVIHLVGIIREHPSRGITFERLHVDGTAKVLSAAASAGVRRIMHMSALGTRPGARSRYHQTKWRAEEAVRASELEWTIVRPSIIFGPGDGFVGRLATLVRRSPVLPVIGRGSARLQPVSVQIVAEGVARALDEPASVGHTYDVGGIEAYTLNAILDQIAAVIHGRPRPKVHVPITAVRALATVFGALPFFPVTVDQLVMLEEDHTCDPWPFLSAFGLKPASFRADLEAMLAP